MTSWQCHSGGSKYHSYPRFHREQETAYYTNYRITVLQH